MYVATGGSMIVAIHSLILAMAQVIYCLLYLVLPVPAASKRYPVPIVLLALRVSSPRLS